MRIKMKGGTEKKLYEEIEISKGINASIEGDVLIMKKEDMELRRRLNPLIGVKVEGDKVMIKTKRTTKKDKKIFGTFVAHIKNMIHGLSERFKYELQVANVHFPMSVIFDKENNEIVVKNFLGEKKDRRIKIREGVNVKIEKDIIELSSYDIEKAGQTAANVEKGTKVRNKDRRVYQDGIFIIKKPWREFL